MGNIRAAQADTQGVMVAVIPPGDLSVRLQDKAKEANPELRLEPLDNMHITLAYLGSMADVSDIEDVEFAVETFAMDTDPLRFEVAGWGRFDNDGQHVLYAAVNVPGIEEWRTKLLDYLGQVDIEPKSDFSFTPHITVAYSDDPIETFPEAVDTDRDWVAEEVVLAKGGQWESYPFGQSYVLVASHDYDWLRSWVNDQLYPSPEHIGQVPTKRGPTLYRGEIGDADHEPGDRVESDPVGWTTRFDLAREYSDGVVLAARGPQAASINELLGEHEYEYEDEWIIPDPQFEVRDVEREGDITICWVDQVARTAAKIDNPFFDEVLVEDFQFEVMDEIDEALGPKASLYDIDWPTRQFDPYEVVPTQPWLNEDKFEYGPGGPMGEPGPAVVIIREGIPYLYDGHHRNYLFRAQGVPTMDAQVIDLDDPVTWYKLNDLRKQKVAPRIGAMRLLDPPGDRDYVFWGSLSDYPQDINSTWWHAGVFPFDPRDEPLHLGTKAQAAYRVESGTHRAVDRVLHKFEIVGPMWDGVVSDNAANYVVDRAEAEASGFTEALEYDYEAHPERWGGATPDEYKQTLDELFQRAGLFYHNASEGDELSVVVPDASWVRYLGAESTGGEHLAANMGQYEGANVYDSTPSEEAMRARMARQFGKDWEEQGYRLEYALDRSTSYRGNIYWQRIFVVYPPGADAPHWTAYERRDGRVQMTAYGVEYRWETGTTAPMPEHLASRHGDSYFDFKPERPLSDPAVTEQIEDLLPGSQHVPFEQVPFWDELNAAQGTTDEMPIEEYRRQREGLWESLPVSQVPLDSKFVVTQPVVNVDRIEQLVSQPSTPGAAKPLWMVRHDERYYTMNGHHRLVANYLRGDDAIQARVLDLSGTTAAVRLGERRPEYDDWLPDGLEVHVRESVVGPPSGRGERRLRVVRIDVVGEGHHVGYIAAMYAEHGYISEQYPEAAVIADVWVDEPYRRMGIATGMLNILRDVYAPIEVVHNEVLTEEGRGWSDVVGATIYLGEHRPEYDEWLPEGLHCEVWGGRNNISNSESWEVHALADEDLVGYLKATYKEGGYRSQGYPDAAVIYSAYVVPDWRRKGVATGMLRIMRDLYAPVEVVHNQILSEEGRGWAEVVGASMEEIEQLPEKDFEELSPLAQKSVMQYISEGGAEDFDEWARSWTYREGEMSLDEMVQFVWDHSPELEHDHGTFEDYHEWYIGGEPRGDAPKRYGERWPVILQRRGGYEAIEDGWHRFHRAVMDGADTIRWVQMVRHKTGALDTWWRDVDVESNLRYNGAMA